MAQYHPMAGSNLGNLSQEHQFLSLSLSLSLSHNSNFSNSTAIVNLMLLQFSPTLGDEFQFQETIQVFKLSGAREAEIR